ncbi:uncharacterized protein LOC142616663 [Castanea sativa]|uniref:uncharacterized protein LOC142616663 n=1 Tax=Castanea sativa TaxID=21020 RepID=UPI003F64B1A2
MQIKDEGTLTFPGKLKGDPNKRPRDRYCRFHGDHGHDTADCYDLKQQIEALIRQGRLQRFVRKERTEQNQELNPKREHERPRPPVADIRMIIGGTASVGSSKKARRTYLRTVHNVQSTGSSLRGTRQNSPSIGFSKEEARRLHHPHDDALVVSIQAGDFNIHRVNVQVYVDDMLVKSAKVSDHLRDLQETFNTLRIGALKSTQKKSKRLWNCLLRRR